MTPPKELSADRATALMAGEERRRSQRVIIRVPVALEATIMGQKVKADAFTVAVNIHGAMVLCPRPFDAEAKLEMRNERTGERIGVRVTRAARESAEGYLIPLEFVAPSPKFWQISFPPENWKSSGL
ncbi:MAG: hypothetical protein LAO08_19050 [Acidobacteriia bacterium]|nr:hypothetical protein [Terriglobia bacterium]